MRQTRHEYARRPRRPGPPLVRLDRPQLERRRPPRPVPRRPGRARLARRPPRPRRRRQRLDRRQRRIVDGYPRVRLVRNDHNGGFVANNLALRDLDGADYVGLVNADSFVEPGWLRPLVGRHRGRRRAGRGLGPPGLRRPLRRGGGRLAHLQPAAAPTPATSGSGSAACGSTASTAGATPRSPTDLGHRAPRRTGHLPVDARHRHRAGAGRRRPPLARAASSSSWRPRRPRR